MAVSVKTDVVRDTRRARIRARRVGRSGSELLFVLPVAVIIGLVVVVPMMSAVAHSFTAWTPGYASPWVGLANYKDIFSSPQFHQLLLNQVFMLIGVPLWVVTPLCISYLLYQGVPGPGVFRAVFFFPAITAPALIGILFSFMLAPDGPLNAAFRAVGLGALAQDWLANAHLVKPVIIMVLAWATLGMGVVLFSAALSAVPPELFESAEIDGASWWQRLWHIMLPSIRRTVELWTVILVIVVFTGIFPWIFTLTRGGPGYSSTTLDWDVYQNALSYGHFDVAAAESVVLLVIVLVVVTVGAIVNRRSERHAA